MNSYSFVQAKQLTSEKAIYDVDHRLPSESICRKTMLKLGEAEL